MKKFPKKDFTWRKSEEPSIGKEGCGNCKSLNRYLQIDLQILRNIFANSYKYVQIYLEIDPLLGDAIASKKRGTIEK